MKKNIIILLLALIIAVLGGYLVHDKVINKSNIDKEDKEETK